MSPSTTASKVAELMTKKVFGVDPAMQVSDALDLAREHHVTHFPVVQFGRALGVVCTHDLEEVGLQSDVSAVMHSPAATIPVESSVGDAAKVMAERGVGSLLVVEKDDIVGIVTRSDFERAGLGEAAFGDQHCSSCGTYEHVKLDPKCGYWLCSECSTRAHNGAVELGEGD